MRSTEIAQHIVILELTTVRHSLEYGCQKNDFCQSVMANKNQTFVMRFIHGFGHLYSIIGIAC